MNIYQKVTKEDLINLSKLAEQQKTQGAIKSKNTILKSTHNFNIAEILSPINKKLDIVKETTKNLGEIIKISDSANETPQLAIENNQNDTHLGVMYDTSLENTLSM